MQEHTIIAVAAVLIVTVITIGVTVANVYGPADPLPNPIVECMRYEERRASAFCMKLVEDK